MNLSQPTQYQHVTASGFDQLVKVQPGRNRRYTQLSSGRLEAEFVSAWLGKKVQIFREKLNVGSRIEANPPPSLLPFTFIFPSSEEVTFCRDQVDFDSSIAQATGGHWEVLFGKTLEYMTAAFDREYFFTGYRQMKQEEVPDDFLYSKTTPTVPILARKYSSLIATHLNQVSSRPELLNDPSIVSLMSSELLLSVINALSAHKLIDFKPDKLKKRQVGVNRVVDYLNIHANDLPDIQTLCAVANLSERSLQYGFMEKLGCTPIQYLRIVRLNGAKLSLEQGNPKVDRVVDIATQWGFVELGRFAKEYKSLFCELPSQTLSRC